MHDEPKAARSVVIGGGIGGLAAALALSPHFGEVWVIERDEYPKTPKSRPHTPQGAHVHLLLAGGLEVLSKLAPQLPGWLDELGLREGDLTRDVRLRYGESWLPKANSGIPIRPCTRPVVEHLLLRAVRDVSNIRILEKSKVIGLVGDDEVSGIRIVHDSHPEEVIDSDWTVDASGRSSKILEWIQHFDVKDVDVETVDAGVIYSSCIFRPSESVDADWSFVGNFPKFPDEPRATAMMKMHDGNWLAAVVGYCNTPPPDSTEEMVEIIGRHLSTPYAEQLRTAQPLTRISHYTNTANRRRRFSRSKNWPDRLISIGDSGCVLNPRYGQGMTVATLSATVMASDLQRYWSRRGSLDGFAHHLQKSIEKMLDIPWNMALLEDRLWASSLTGGSPRLFDRLSSRISRRMIEVLFCDIGIYIQFMRVAHMIDPPASLLNPRTLRKFITHGPRTANQQPS